MVRSSGSPRPTPMSRRMRSEEHTSELQSPQISYAVFCLKKEEHTSELQSPQNLVCRLLLEKKSCRRGKIAEAVKAPIVRLRYVLVTGGRLTSVSSSLLP